MTCTTNIDHLVNELQLENLYGFQDQGKLHLRHDRDVDDLDTTHCAPGVAQKRACQNPVQTEESRRSFAQFALWVHVSAAQQERPTTVGELHLGTFKSKHCWNLSLHGLQEDAARPAPPPTPVPTTTATIRPPPLLPAAS